jgi:hypothetical protein
MRFSRAVSDASARSLAVGLCAVAALASGACLSPEDQSVADAPRPPFNAAVVPTSGLVGEWKLDESNGSTTAFDTKNDNDATVQGGAAFVQGHLGNALKLDNGAAGTGGKYAQIPSDPTLNTVQLTSYSISAWFKALSVPSDNSLDNRYWAIVVKPGATMGLVFNNASKFSMRHYLTDGTLLIAQGSTIYPAGQWHHLVGTVSKIGGQVKLYVDGALLTTTTFTAGTAGRDYGTTGFRIGKAQTNWAADGLVDQVRIYDRVLSVQDVTDLFNESPGFRFPVAMTKGAQIDLIGASPTPDGLEMAARTVSALRQVVDTARARGARVAVRVNRPNQDLADANGNFVLSRWKADFDVVSGVDLSSYVEDGTLVGLYAIDEPFADFNNMSSTFLENICAYAKSFVGWRSVPCIVRELNTRLYTNRPAGGTYLYVDAGWAQLVDHVYVPPQTYNGSMRAFFDSNLAQGARAGLALVYGFNLLNGGREVAGCPKPSDPNDHNCAMSAAEVRAVADTLALIGHDQGCGVNGWRIDPSPGPERDYYFSQGVYANNGIQSALQYMNSTLGGLRPLQFCNVRGDLPAP